MAKGKKISPPSAKELAELGLVVGEDGLCGLVALTGMSGSDFSVSRGEPLRRNPASAVRHVRARYARPDAAQA